MGLLMAAVLGAMVLFILIAVMLANGQGRREEGRDNGDAGASPIFVGGDSRAHGHHGHHGHGDGDGGVDAGAGHGGDGGGGDVGGGDGGSGSD